MASLYKILIGNLSKLGLSLGISMALGVILKAYMPRVLGVESIGVFYHADSLSFIFFTFLPLGIHTYINRVIPPNPEKAKEIFKSIFIFMMIYGNLLWLFLFIYAKLLGLNQHLWIIIIIGGYQFLSFFTNEIIKPTFIAADLVNFVSRQNIINKFTQVGIVCGGLFFFSDLKAAAILYFSAQLISFLFYIIKAFSMGWLKGQFSFSYCRNFISIGLPFFVNNALLSFYGNIDIAMLERLANTSEVGWYGASQQLKGIFMMVVPLLYTVIMPLLSKVLSKSNQQFQEFSTDIYGVLIFSSWLLSLGMASFANEFVVILFGMEFQPARQSVILLAPVLLFTYMNVFLSMVLNLLSSGKGMVITTLASLVVNASLNFVLIPWGTDHWAKGGGGIGASLTTIIAELVVFSALLYLTPLKLMTSKNIFSSICSFVMVGSLMYFLITEEYSFAERIGIFSVLFVLTVLGGLLCNRHLLKKFLKSS